MANIMDKVTLSLHDFYGKQDNQNKLNDIREVAGESMDFSSKYVDAIPSVVDLNLPEPQDDLDALESDVKVEEEFDIEDAKPIPFVGSLTKTLKRTPANMNVFEKEEAKTQQGLAEELFKASTKRKETGDDIRREHNTSAIPWVYDDKRKGVKAYPKQDAKGNTIKDKDGNIIWYHNDRPHKFIGKPTVGIGHLVTKENGQEVADILFSNDKFEIDDRLNEIHDRDWAKHNTQARTIENFEKLSPIEQHTITDVIFNMGFGKFKKDFNGTVNAIHNLDKDPVGSRIKIGQELLYINPTGGNYSKSKYWKDVGNRALNNAKIFDPKVQLRPALKESDRFKKGSNYDRLKEAEENKSIGNMFEFLQEDMDMETKKVHERSARDRKVLRDSLKKRLNKHQLLRLRDSIPPVKLPARPPKR